MSMNYCEKNPVQGLMNTHCWHDVGLSKARKDGTVTVSQVCCWCDEKTTETKFVTHGPYPKRPRKARR